MNARAQARNARRQAEMLEACATVSEAHDAAKHAYREALAAGDARQIAETRKVKADTAHRLNQTRRWLRAEKRLRDLPGQISQATSKLERLRASTDLTAEDAELRDSLPKMIAAMQAESPRLEAMLTPIRQGLAGMGAVAPSHVDVTEQRPGDATAAMPSVKATAQAKEVG
ncbi:MAG TPA: hypothetical protein VIR33_01675 [Thermopolyspora sp.]